MLIVLISIRVLLVAARVVLVDLSRVRLVKSLYFKESILKLSKEIRKYISTLVELAESVRGIASFVRILVDLDNRVEN